jgi:asparagine synthase (glutamine-hydrolysing)
MCGFAGSVSSTPHDALAWMERSSDLLRHRGPDDEGFWILDASWSPSNFAGRGSAPGVALPRLTGSVAARAALVHRRLSIIDLSAAGHQPMSAPSGTTVVLNGEIYNYRELRTELARAGWEFRSQSDTEVALAAYECWGSEAIRRFVGMWALAILDPRRNVLLLSRDPFGIKPLFIAQTRGACAFASEIAPLLEVPWVDRTPDLGRIAGFLLDARADDGESTFYRGVRQVPPASIVEFPLDADAASMAAPRIRRYWTPPYDATHDLSLPEAVERVRTAFVESVELHLRSDVAVGACLSGGIDSSAIVCAMREIGGRSLELHTFSYVSADPQTSEERWIEVVNRQVGAIAHLVRPADGDFGRDLERLALVQHEPFASTSVYAQYRVFAAAHDAGVKVLLDGQGADELLAGYPAYRTAMLRGAVRSGALLRAAPLAYGLARTRTSGRNDLTALVTTRLSSRRRRRSAAAAPWTQAARDAVGQRSDRAGDDLVSQLVQSIVSSSLPSLLRYEDRNSMAHSVESRVPFLTTAFAELTLGLAPTQLVSRSGITKNVFRLAMRGLVPDVVLDRRDKVGFVPTEDRWLAYAPLVPVPSAPPTVRSLFAADLESRIAEAQRVGQVDPQLWRSWAVLEWAHRTAGSTPSGEVATEVGSLDEHE